MHFANRAGMLQEDYCSSPTPPHSQGHSLTRLSAIALMCLPLMLSGCSGLTQLQSTITDFDKVTHTIATSQMSYIHAVQTAECTNQFYQSALLWSLNQPNARLDLAGVCTPQAITTEQIATRETMLNAITLYADKISALATDDQDKQLDANAQMLAANLRGLTAAKLPGLGGITLGSALPPAFNGNVAAGVAAAIDELAQMVLDNVRFKEIKKSANDMQPYLTTVVEALKAENTLYALSIASSLGNVQQNLETVVKDSRNARIRLVARTKAELDILSRGHAPHLEGAEGNIAAMSFADVVAARQLLRTANPFGELALSLPIDAKDLSTDAGNLSLQLNSNLDALLKTNRVIATAGTGGIIAAVNDLRARAQAAQAIDASLKK